jgi:tetratricopeptide (TPR) repeat protein
MGARLDRVLLLGLATVLFVSPLLLLPGNYEAANLPQTAFIDAAAVVLFLVFLAGAWFKGRLELVPLGPLLLPSLFLLWAGLSLFWATNRYEGAIILVHWTCCLVLGVIAGAVVSSPREERLLLGALLASGSLAALLGIGQHLLGIVAVPQSFGPSATFVNKNVAAEFAIMVIPVGVFLAVTSEGAWSVVCALGSVVLTTYVVYTRTRAAFAALFAEAVVLVAARGRSVPRRRGFVLAALVLLACAFLGPGGFENGPRRVWEELVQPFRAGDQAADTPSVVSVRARSAIWRNTMAMIGDHPLQGVGLGNHPVLYPRYARAVVIDPLFSPALQLDYAHSDYLQLTAELGVVGLALLLLSLWRLLVAVWPLSGNDLFLGLSLVGLLVDGAFAFPLYRALPPLLAAVLLGLLLGRTGARFVRLSWGRAPSLLALTACLVLGLVLLDSLAGRVIADRHIARMVAFGRRHDLVNQKYEAQAAHLWDPGRKEPLFALGSVYLEAGEPDHAAEALEALVARYPYDIAALGNLGLAYARAKFFDKALEANRRAVALKRDEAVLHARMAELLQGEGRAKEALDEARLAASAESGNALYQYRRGLLAMQVHSWDEAEEALRRAITLEPQKATAHKALGVLLLQQGRPLEGVAEFQEALAIDPQIADAAHMRELIERQRAPAR